MNSESIAKPRRKRHEARLENERQILAAAAHAFAQSGFEGATISEIAGRSGFPAATVHYYFATKEILYRRVLYDIQDIWAEPLSLFREEADPADVLRSYIRAKILLARDYPVESRVFANELLHGAPYLETYLRTTYNDKIEPVWRTFEAWIAKGLIDPIDPRGLMLTLWASTQTYADFEVQVRAIRRRERLTDKDYEAAIAQLAAVIIKGIGARDRTARPDVVLTQTAHET